MNILTDSIVSNSDMIKKYKSCREKAESLGKIIIMKNNQPDAVLFSISEYERLSVLIEYLKNLEGQDATKIAESLSKEENLKRSSINELIHTMK